MRFFCIINPDSPDNKKYTFDVIFQFHINLRVIAASKLETERTFLKLFIQDPQTIFVIIAIINDSIIGTVTISLKFNPKFRNLGYRGQR